MTWQLTDTSVEITQEEGQVSIPYDQIKSVHLNKTLEKAGKYSARSLFSMKISDGSNEHTTSVRSDESTSDFDKLQKGLHARLLPYKEKVEFTKGEKVEQKNKIKAMLWLLVVPVILISISIGVFLVTHDHWSGALLFVLALILIRYLNNMINKNTFGHYDPERIPRNYLT